MINQFWKDIDLHGRDRSDLKQFQNIGEEFEPPARTKKPRIPAEGLSPRPSKVQRVS